MALYHTVNGSPVEVKHINYGTTVGYTKVGSPTISNGVVSGFSDSNYLVSSQALDVANYDNLEFYIRCKTPIEFVTSTWTNYITNGTTVNNAGRTLGVYKGSSNTVFNVFGTDMYTYTVSENTWYRVKLVCTSDTQTATIYNDDGAILIGPVSTTRNINNNKTLMIGGGTAANIGSFGQIDLNETYIKANGKLWFFQPSTNYLVKDNKLVFADSGLYLSGPNTYTKVGSPTIVDNVASGFENATNYLTIGTVIPFATANDWEIKTAFRLERTSEEVISQIFDFTSANNGVSLYYRKDIEKIFVGIGDGTNTILSDYSYTPQLNTWYFVKISFNGSEYKYEISTDNNNWQTVKTVTSSVKTANTTAYYQSIGVSRRYSSERAFPGGIDLNQTYIKVNGDLWFYGKNYATQNIAPVPSGYTYGTTTTSAIGYVDMRTQVFTAAPSGATIGRDE